MLPVTKEYRPFWLRRLHSLTGLVPLGSFFLLHLFANARAMQGERGFRAMVLGIQGVPGLLLVELLLVFLPLAIHAGIGLSIALCSRPNVGAYPLPRNWSYVLQRVTGVVTFAFLAYHLASLRLRVALGSLGPTDFFSTLTDALSTTTAYGFPTAAVVYLIGIAAASYHLANGIAGFCWTWGITITRRGNRIAGAAGTAVGACTFLLGATTVLYYATGSPWLGERSSPSLGGERGAASTRGQP